MKRDEGSETAAAAAGTIESQIPTESVAAPPAEHQRSLSDEDDNHPEPVQTTQEVWCSDLLSSLIKLLSTMKYV